jgi:ATP-dependent Clp protease ATP-binding subunit ClpC
VYNTFLQVLDDGRLTDGLGRTVDFRRVILIMTSNTGFNQAPAVGFQTDGGVSDVTTPLRDIFAPEFLDRLDEVISFDAFDEAGILRITGRMLEEIRDELASRDVSVTFAREVPSWLVSRVPHGRSARPMRAVLREYVEDPLSTELLARGSDDPIVVTVEDDALVFARPVPIV